MRADQNRPREGPEPDRREGTARRASRRAFIRTGAAVAGGIILGTYVKPSMRSFAVDQVFANGSPLPPPPTPPPGDGCSPHTIGYWKNLDFGSWPLASIQVGCAGNYISSEDAQKWLKANASDMTRMLAAQLIGAQLNVAANGGSCDSTIRETIDDANEFLCAHWFGSDLTETERTYAEQLKDALDTFNNGSLSPTSWGLGSG